ncbi:hypothetical protein [Streptomyces sp. MNP-20]|uniref:hypothetical protein n=1 Tax=Streptomyces sp. MNP-20 TaxID=2721165 RepID=UPI002814C686|nr:hypothetical protein [Streptomyces sp. MNP-20]
MGHSIEQLWQHRDHGLLDDRHTRLAEAHRDLVQAETTVTFYRSQLASLSSGEYPVDQALVARIGRTLGMLKEAARDRDQRQADTIAALESIEAVTCGQPRSVPDLSAPDTAALLAIAQGAKLHQHLLTGRLSLVTASGARIPYSQLQRLEADHLVARDTAHPVIAGQPVTVTDTGRAALTSSRPATTPTPRPGTWPAAAPSRGRR